MKLLNILTLGAIAGSLMLTSCSSSFLDVESKTESNTDTFYKTEQDALRALVGCYAGWKLTNANPGISFYVGSTVMSDECYGGSGNGDGRGYQVIDRFDQAQSPGDQNLYEEDWKRYYEAIYRCNTLLQYEDQIQWTSDATKGRLLGECHALRAILYFDLVRLFGNIPFFTVPSSENKAQADPAEVYGWIFQDLRYAIENIPADMYHGSNFPDAASVPGTVGRITKQAAEGMLARAYLYYTGYYGKEPGWTDEEMGTIGTVTKSEALAAAEDAITSGFYTLIPDGEFATMWPAASLVPAEGPVPEWDPELSTYLGYTNSEVMLQMNFTPGDYGSDASTSNRWIVLIGPRQINVSPIGKGWGIATVCPAFLNYFSSDDTRKKASVVDMAAEGLTASPLFHSNYLDWREYTGYTIKKYSPICYHDDANGGYQNGSVSISSSEFQINNTQPWYILRLADVMLMAAELGSSNAQTYMDQIRQRAGLSSIQATQENIMAERARELAFEGIRYWDLLRQSNGGDVNALVSALQAVEGRTESGGLEDYVTYDPSKILATRGLCQIPYNQITLSNYVLKQNPGW